jgi:multiple sugar transport system permease protein
MGQQRRRKRKLNKRENIVFMILLALIAVVICSPIYLLLEGSFMSGKELESHLSVIFKGGQGYASWRLIPTLFSLKSYEDLLIFSPAFYLMFWNSVKLVFCILVGQFLIAVPAAWGFSKGKIPHKNALFNLYIVLMLMPFQVTMLSNYLTLDSLHLINHQASVILPAVFSTFPVFIIYRFFCNVPDSVLEAAKMDGASKLQTFIKIGIPLGSAGIISAIVLGFLEYWNMIEQPLTFLKDKTLWPLSLYLPNIGLEEAGMAFVASVIALIPCILIFIAGQEYLELGIAAVASKE